MVGSRVGNSCLQGKGARPVVAEGVVDPAAPLEGAVRLWSREPMKSMKDMKDEDLKVIDMKVGLVFQ